MMRPSILEFYDGNRMEASVESSMVPPVGAKISIRKKVWKVTGVTYALDHAGRIGEEAMRANIDIQPVKE